MIESPQFCTKLSRARLQVFEFVLGLPLLE